MRVNLSAIQRGELELASVAATVAPGELDVLTNGLIDRQLTLLLGAVDADVTFVPVDPAASAGDEP